MLDLTPEEVICLIDFLTSLPYGDVPELLRDVTMQKLEDYLNENY